MSGSNCCFLSYIQVSQETDKVVWYSHLFKNFPQFVVIHKFKTKQNKKSFSSKGTVMQKEEVKKYLE